MDGRTDGQTNGRTDGPTDGRKGGRAKDRTDGRRVDGRMGVLKSNGRIDDRTVGGGARSVEECHLNGARASRVLDAFQPAATASAQLLPGVIVLVRTSPRNLTSASGRMPSGRADGQDGRAGERMGERSVDGRRVRPNGRNPQSRSDALCGRRRN